MKQITLLKLLLPITLFTCAPAAATSNSGNVGPSQSQAIPFHDFDDEDEKINSSAAPSSALIRERETSNELVPVGKLRNIKKEALQRALFHNVSERVLPWIHKVVGQPSFSLPACATWSALHKLDSPEISVEDLRAALFIVAIRHATAAEVEVWLANGMDPNTSIINPSRYCDGPYPVLMHAILRGIKEEKKATEIIKLLLDYGADVNIKGRLIPGGNMAPAYESWFTPLSLAAALHAAPIIKILLERGANVNGLQGHSPASHFDQSLGGKIGSPIEIASHSQINAVINPPNICWRYWNTIYTLLHAGVADRLMMEYPANCLYYFYALQSYARVTENNHIVHNDNPWNSRLPWHALLPRPEENRSRRIREALQPFIATDLHNIVIGYAGCMQPEIEQYIYIKTIIQAYERNLQVILNKAAAKIPAFNGRETDFKFAAPIIGKFLGVEKKD